MKVLQKYKAYSIDLIIAGDGITAIEILWIADQAKRMLQVCPIYGAGMDIDPYEFRVGVKEKTSRKRGPRAKVQPMLELGKAA
jgi:hypothetical protein